jgi:hypothetical protein
MTSGAWITLYLLGGLGFLLTSFAAWEAIQLLRRRAGNKSALTLTQYTTRKAKNGSLKWRIFTIAFPVFLMLIGLWLIFHFEGLCREIELFCEISGRV